MKNGVVTRFYEETGNNAANAFLKMMGAHSDLRAHILGKASEYICDETWRMFCRYPNTISQPGPYGSNKFPLLPCWKYEDESIGELPDKVTKANWFISPEQCSKEFSPVIYVAFGLDINRRKYDLHLFLLPISPKRYIWNLYQVQLPERETMVLIKHSAEDGNSLRQIKDMIEATISQINTSQLTLTRPSI